MLDDLTIQGEFQNHHCKIAEPIRLRLLLNGREPKGNVAYCEDGSSEVFEVKTDTWSTAIGMGLRM